MRIWQDLVGADNVVPWKEYSKFIPPERLLLQGHAGFTGAVIHQREVIPEVEFAIEALFDCKIAGDALFCFKEGLEGAGEFSEGLG